VSRQTSTLLALLAAVALAACSPHAAKSSGQAGAATPGGLNKTILESRIDARFGGIGTCLVIADARSGEELYRYNTYGVCSTPLPPCATFEVPLALIGLDAGAVTPTGLVKWDGTPQPIPSWQKDTDLKTAFGQSIAWFFGALARKLGAETLKERLNAFDYGNKAVEGPITGFWIGPAQGGQLGVSTRQQAEFMHRLYAGKLPVKPEALSFVQGALVDEIRGPFTMSGKAGSCPTLSDGSRQVGWWAGRLKGPDKDYVFAASIEASNDNALPGSELQARVKSVFADAGLWPAV
jgi:beta-lactamase class D